MEDHNYFDARRRRIEPTVNTSKLTEDETGRVFAMAESWAERCHALGTKPPPDALRALIAAAEHLFGCDGDARCNP